MAKLQAPVQPWGNALLSGNEQTSSGLGFFRLLPDNLLFELLLSLDWKLWARLCQTSRAMRCYIYHDEHWRMLYIQTFNSLDFYTSWRETFKRAYCQQAGLGVPVLDRPVHTSGIYSDHLFSSWRATNIPSDALGTLENVDRRSNLTMDEFITEYAQKNVPVIITDTVGKWPASKWTIGYLLDKHSSKKFNAESMKLSLKEYVQYMNAQQDESPLYLFDKEFANDSHLSEEYIVPEYFSQDLFSVLKNRPDYRWLIIGPKRSGSTFHKDPNATSAWNAVIKGKKRWVLYPPSQTPPGVYTDACAENVTSPVSVAEWFLRFYDETNFAPHGSKKKGPMHCTVNEGEIMFVPSGWWHCVMNMQDSIAITQNFVNEWNLPQVLEFLRDKPEQVSGYEGDLHSDFTRALKERMPELEMPVVKKRRTLFEPIQSTFSFGFALNEKEEVETAKEE